LGWRLGKEPVTKLAVAIGCASFLLVSAQTVDAKPVWKAVPNREGVFVDMTSIVHFDVSNGPSHCDPAVPSPPQRCPLPPPDTTADIKVDDAIAKAYGFWCKNPHVKIGNAEFGIVGGEAHSIPVNAAKRIVCGAPKIRPPGYIVSSALLLQECPYILIT
jgi:hypothetical protein